MDFGLDLPPEPAFANSMVYGNTPGMETPNPGASDDRNGGGQERHESKSDGDSGMVSAPSVADFPKLNDPHEPPGYPENGSDELSDYGLKETGDAGGTDSVHSYGLTKGA